MEFPGNPNIASKISEALELPTSPPTKTGGKSQVRVPFAEKDGRLVHVSAVERGLKCAAVCPVCRTAVVARKGDKTRHHFAHYPGANCSAETALHFIAKQLIYDKLITALSIRQVICIYWKCIVCSGRHDLNLLDGISSVVTEKSMGTCRPDIALLDSDRNPRILLEIVVSHRPDPLVLDFCSQGQIPLLIFRVRDAESLETLAAQTKLDPTVVLYCPRQRCTNCGGPLFPKRMFFFSSRCWRCNGPMKIAVMEINDKLYGPDYFSESDRRFAHEQGVVFRQHLNKTKQQMELALGCMNCGVATGSRYLGFHKKRTQKLPGHLRGTVCLKCRAHVDLK